LIDDQLFTLAVQGMLLTWREKLLGQEFDNLGQVVQRITMLNRQMQSMRRDTQFQKGAMTIKTYSPYMAEEDYEEDEEEVAAAEWNWGKKVVMVQNPWGRENEESYDFDITMVDKLFDFLLERAQIKLPPNHVMLPLEQLRNKKFCKYHNATSHTTNDCIIFRQHI
jgi:hypothetical protein